MCPGTTGPTPVHRSRPAKSELPGPAFFALTSPAPVLPAHVDSLRRGRPGRPGSGWAACCDVMRVTEGQVSHGGSVLVPAGRTASSDAVNGRFDTAQSLSRHASAVIGNRKGGWALNPCTWTIGSPAMVLATWPDGITEPASAPRFRSTK